MLGIPQLMQLGGLFGERPLSIGHLETATSTNEFTGWLFHGASWTATDRWCGAQFGW
ncbi:hypothetical protein [Haloterrigena sp. H1]|uniref:hypothetical protein n=1 Tax=Haloterrigena sp. H1 TaxID=2552943 RepID=UPI00148756D3|nr:hypothetical protein [Haloterrigena sp. H1]